MTTTPSPYRWTVDDVRRASTPRNIAVLRAVSDVMSALSVVLHVATDEMEAGELDEAMDSLQMFTNKMNEAALLLARKGRTS